ncbi:MAG: hypothetical protein ACI93S_000207 [Ancylomarina sp.]|jgi:hypothetical protein
MRRYISAYFTDEEDLLRASKILMEKQIPILDVLTPFPVHGLDKVLGLKESRLPTIGFIAGGLGTIFAFGFQTWAFVVDYPLFIGGKPHFSIPSFIPITFEVTILFAAFAMVFAFLFRSKLGLGAKNKIHDERITDDHFVIIIDIVEKDDHFENVKRILEQEKAQDIQIKENE